VGSLAVYGEEEVTTPAIAETTDNYYHVRFADPDEFDTIRTPDWAENAATSVTEAVEVRTGHETGGGDSDWDIQSVSIPTEDETITQAQQIVERVEA